MTAGPVDLTVSFLSPVEVCEFLWLVMAVLNIAFSRTTWSSTQSRSHTLRYRQQLMMVAAILWRSAQPRIHQKARSDVHHYALHSFQLYIDISGEWVTGDNSLVANWTTSAGDIVTHQVQLVNQTVFGEINDHIQRSAFIAL